MAVFKMSLRFVAVTGAALALASVLLAHQFMGDGSWFDTRERLRVGAYEGDVGVLQWIAQEQGYYDKVGLDIELQGFPSGKAATDALAAGKIDVATAAEFVVASRSFKEADLRVLANICHYRNKGIVARRDSGIEQPADLKGKKIGVTVPSGSEYALHVFLALNGVKLSDVEIVPTPAPEIVAALAAGKVDAISTWEPHVRKAQDSLGENASLFEGSSFDTYLLLLTREANTQTQPRALKKLLRAMVMAEDWLRVHPEEAKAFIAKRFKVEGDYVANLWPRMNFTVNLPQEILPAMDGEALWLKRGKGEAAADIPNYADFVWSDGMQAVRPSAVTLFAKSR
ncbi:MAG: NrtA/SsuA/CpmA family ABC transporter substrate-binding protein [Pseudomonadota bacterium]